MRAQAWARHWSRLGATRATAPGAPDHEVLPGERNAAAAFKRWLETLPAGTEVTMYQAGTALMRGRWESEPGRGRDVAVGTLAPMERGGMETASAWREIGRLESVVERLQEDVANLRSAMEELREQHETMEHRIWELALSRGAAYEGDDDDDEGADDDDDEGADDEAVMGGLLDEVEGLVLQAGRGMMSDIRKDVLPK